MTRDPEHTIGEAAKVIRATERNRIFLICDHASNRIPPELGDMGLNHAERKDHIAWDIGAAQVTHVLSAELCAPAVLGSTSRHVVDLNRRPEAPDVIPVVTHGVRVPGNEMLSAEDRASRFERFYQPYHDAIDRLLRRSDATVVVSIHSFSHDLDVRAQLGEPNFLFEINYFRRSHAGISGLLVRWSRAGPFWAGLQSH